MDCAEEIAVLKRELGPLVGSEDWLVFDILNGKLVVESGTDSVSTEAIIQAVARTGMRAEVWQATASAVGDAGFWQQHARTVLTGASGLCGLSGLVVHAWLAGGIMTALGSEGMGVAHGVPLVAILLYAIGIVTGVWLIIPKAWRAAVGFRPDMNLLMTIAVIGAVAIGEWFEAVTVVFLFSVSLLLESWSVGRARRAVAALMDLTPPTARVRDDEGNEQIVAPKDVAIGAIFVVRPAEKIPLDGTVVRGASDVNQAPITGESVPVAKSPDSEVFAGTVNGNGVLEIECTKPASDTTLAHIIRMVGEAQSRRAPSEKWVEKFARVYTPTVMILAAAVLLIPPLVFGGPWLDWLYRSLVLLVIACPCALVISTPVSIVAALAAAARNGVLIKGGVFVEAPARLLAIAMDKTGTLTEGRPSVVDVVPMSGHDDVELLQRVAALESHSNHPLAQAIVAAANDRGVTILDAEEFEIIQGKGAMGRINGKPYWLGSHRFLEERGQETADVHERLEAMQQAGRTVVVVGNDSHVCGFLTLADSLRPTATESIKRLREAGVDHIVMLTGDNEGTAHVIADQAGIDEVQAELLPEDKVRAVEALVAKHGQVAMIGDGVNDAPALGRASMGIAMGAVGSDAAIETADIALMSDDLSKLPWLIGHSRRALAVIRQNITFALAVKAIFVILTFAGYASLWAAIAADMGASLLVILNGLRLLNTAHS
ncbi:MAG: cadmium-translocating P-type ATPase [Planctomycetota bacterium]|nr:MAG: cadmium-translocating P-type ATPase [Planctomycetota bacterium]REK26000.1 MAG: cadmium-translocating P-type ATPase [Planctomycetota bacterium]REK46885.1 MAG: cadmium-translocating P-type ATPase [Planctomycetota bacterium]